MLQSTVRPAITVSDLTRHLSTRHAQLNTRGLTINEWPDVFVQLLTHQERVHVVSRNMHT